MRALTKLRLRIGSLLRHRHVDAELDEEFRYHLERLIDDHIAAGLAPAEARYRAMREMGAMQQRKEECRESRGLTVLDSIAQDCRYAVRGLRRTPAFTVVALLSLAIGIGANTTIFTLVNAVLLRPLPYPDPERLIVVRERALTSDATVGVHPANFLEWQKSARSFESMALLQTPPLNVMGSGGAEQIGRVQTTPDLFRVFGVAPVLGRDFTEADARPGSPDVVVLGHGFWQRWFGGDPNVLDRTLATPTGALTIIGVGPPGFRIGTIEPQVLTPLAIDPANPASVGSRGFQCYGRLAVAQSLERARAEMDSIAANLSRRYTFDEGMGVAVIGLHDYLVKESRPALRLLMAVVATVLVIACVNLAGLLLARGVARRSELALRVALGASRRRIIRQLTIESLLLSAFGGAAGLAVALFGTRALAVATTEILAIPTSDALALDATCVFFTIAMSTLTAVAFGLVPALEASRIEPQTAMRERSRSATGDRRQHRLRSMLVVAEVALAVVLLVGAGLLLRSFTRLGNVSLGFQPAQALTMGLFLGVRPPETRVALVEQILERVEAVPGVKAAGTIQFLPLAGMTCGTGVWLATQSAGTVPTDCSLVSRGYFAAMGIPIREGRAFARQDAFGTARVVMVNQTFAQRYFPDGGALGRRIHVKASNQAPAEIIGIAGDSRHSGLTTEPTPTVYLLHAQTPGYLTNLVVRTDGEPMAHAAAIRRAIQDVDRTQAVANVKPLEDYVRATLARPQLYAVMVGAFALVSVLLAGIGIYGLIAYVVAQRLPEIRVRLALGASRRQVFVEQCRRGSVLVAIGFAVGIAAAWTMRGLLASYLFDITAGDPLTYVIAGVLFSIVALAAVTIPARRASLVEPTMMDLSG